MSLIHAARTRLRLLFSRHRVETRMDEEMRFHVEMEADRLVREQGLSADEAWRRAQITFGGTEKYKEQMRDGRGFAWLSSLSLDMKLGVRMLIKYPGLTLAGVLSIAVAVALAVSWFEFSSDIFRPKLPLEDGDRLVILTNWDVEAGAQESRSLHDFETWRSEIAALEDLTAASQVTYNVSTEDRRTGTFGGSRITASGFELARVGPLLGRPLLPSDEGADAPAVVVIGHSVWQRLFDEDPAVLGRMLRLSGRPATVVGVMPEGFAFPVNQELWVPFRESALAHARREGPRIWMAARLAPGYTLAQAQAELATIGRRSAAESPQTHEHLEPRVQLFTKAASDDVGAFAALINVPFILFLIVVCANVATLVFARTATREGEIAVRSALGASRRRLVLQLFSEALVLTAVGAAVGLTAAHFGLQRGMALFWEVQQIRPPFWFSSGVSAVTVAYAAVLAVIAACIIGGVPALKATGRKLRHRLAQPGTGGAGMRFGAVSTGVIIVQVALCVAFLPIAIMSGRDLLPERRTELNFPADAFLTGEVVRQAPERVERMPGADAGDRHGTVELFAEVQRRIAAEPGVQAVTFAGIMPGMNHPVDAIQLEDDSTHLDEVRVTPVDHNFIDVMGGRIVAGRGFHYEDITSGARVLIVDEEWARTSVAAANPLGHRVRFPGRPGEEANRWYEIVGVVAGMERARGPAEDVAIYEPLLPGASPGDVRAGADPGTVVRTENASAQMYVRTSGEPEMLVPQVHDILAAVDPSITAANMMPLDVAWQPVYRANVFFVGALATIAGVILGFALIGIYALMSFTVSQREREIGIRAALGANPRRIVISIFTRAFIQISLGVIVGATLISLTVMTTPGGIGIVSGVAAMMLVCGMIGCIIPAMRALRIQPTEALRAE
jgi:predicted permease